MKLDNLAGTLAYLKKLLKGILSQVHKSFSFLDLKRKVCFLGPGLAIRVLCTREPFMDDDFGTTNTFLATLSTFYGSNLVVRFNS